MLFLLSSLQWKQTQTTYPSIFLPLNWNIFFHCYVLEVVDCRSTLRTSPVHCEARFMMSDCASLTTPLQVWSSHHTAACLVLSPRETSWYFKRKLIDAIAWLCWSFFVYSSWFRSFIHLDWHNRKWQVLLFCFCIWCELNIYGVKLMAVVQTIFDDNI